jgi:hypothetical protein
LFHGRKLRLHWRRDSRRDRRQVPQLPDRLPLFPSHIFVGGYVFFSFLGLSF